MANLSNYLDKRGISDEKMNRARQETQAIIDAYNLKEARKISNMTQVQIAREIGASQNRVSRMVNGIGMRRASILCTVMLLPLEVSSLLLPTCQVGR